MFCIGSAPQLLILHSSSRFLPTDYTDFDDHDTNARVKHSIPSPHAMTVLQDAAPWAFGLSQLPSEQRVTIFDYVTHSNYVDASVTDIDDVITFADADFSSCGTDDDYDRYVHGCIYGPLRFPVVDLSVCCRASAYFEHNFIRVLTFYVSLRFEFF